MARLCHYFTCIVGKEYVAKRVMFRSGERFSVLKRAGGLPVHEVVLFLGTFRTKGRAANTIHGVCRVLALLHRNVRAAQVHEDEHVPHDEAVARPDGIAYLRDLFSTGNFLSTTELVRLAEIARYHIDDEDDDDGISKPGRHVINFNRVRMRRGRPVKDTRKPVEVDTHGTRIRYMAAYLKFVAGKVAETLPPKLSKSLKSNCQEGLETLAAYIPPKSDRAKLGKRVGLSEEEQARLVAVVHPSSPENPWQRGFVRKRNWIIVVLLLATGIRRGELLGLQISDLVQREPKIRIYRRADAAEDPRLDQPNTKTSDREIELHPAIMRELWRYIHVDRHAIRAARRVPQVIVADDGTPLSGSSIDKMFQQLRQACPGLPMELVSHVMRHSWNERFSEQAEALGMSEIAEEQARKTQQGWSETSKMPSTYTRRYNERKGREVSLKMQEKLDAQIRKKN